MLAASLSVVAASLTWTGAAQAQTTSTVYGTSISEGARSFQVGGATTQAGDGREDRTGARFVYDHSLDSRRMVRFQVVANDRGKEGMEIAFIQPSFYQELTADDAKFWKSLLRLDLRLAEGQAPEQANLHWANQFDLSKEWRARAHLIGTGQFGDAAADGLFVSFRSNLSRSLGNGRYLAVDMFNNLGSTSAMGSFRTQIHQAGPTYTARLNDKLTWNVGVLFGLNDRSPDADLRFWLGQSLE
jgi:hypothetical protein